MATNRIGFFRAAAERDAVDFILMTIMAVNNPIGRKVRMYVAAVVTNMKKRTYATIIRTTNV